TATVDVDRTAPTVTYTGNHGSYALLANVAMTCTAADNLSGVASTTCANVSGAAWTFGAGTHTFSATATDAAGNTGSGTTSFTVTVTAHDLCTLTGDFVRGSARYAALGPLGKAIVDAVVAEGCRLLTALGP